MQDSWDRTPSDFAANRETMGGEINGAAPLAWPAPDTRKVGPDASRTYHPPGA